MKKSRIIAEGYETLNMIQGKYYLYRRFNKETRKGEWLAEDSKTGEIFPITYEQAIGYELIRPTKIQKLSRQLGRILLSH